MIVAQGNGKKQRIAWNTITRCTPGAKQVSRLLLSDGSRVTVRTGDMSRRVSQLFHQMIERHGANASVGPPLISMVEFFARAKHPEAIEPNLQPHPPLDAFRSALAELQERIPGTTILFQLTEDFEESFGAESLVIVTPAGSEALEAFGKAFGADGVVAAEERIIRGAGERAKSANVWQVLWD